MIDLILHILLLGVVVIAIAKHVPGIWVSDYLTAVAVATVYVLINVTLGTVAKLVTLPLIILTLGFFTLVINATMLWATDQMFDDFEIYSIGSLMIAAIFCQRTAPARSSRSRASDCQSS